MVKSVTYISCYYYLGLTLCYFTFRRTHHKGSNDHHHKGWGKRPSLGIGSQEICQWMVRSWPLGDPSRKVNGRDEKKMQWLMLTVDIDCPRWSNRKNAFSNFEKMIFLIYQNFYFLRYFWHKNLKQVFMPKVTQKIKVLKNKSFIISELSLQY